MSSKTPIQKAVAELLQIVAAGVSGDLCEKGSKYHFLRVGRKVLTAIASRLELPDGSYEIRFNPAGPAVGGDYILHGESLYISMTPSAYLGDEFMYRRCHGRKDYTGGGNHWMKWTKLQDFDAAVAAFKSVMEGP